MKKNQIIQTLLGLVIAICVAVFSFSFNHVLGKIEAHEDEYNEDKRAAAARDALLLYKVEQLQTDSDIDVEQNRRLAEQRNTDRKFWRLHNHSKKEIDMLRIIEGKGLSEWPDLDINE